MDHLIRELADQWTEELILTKPTHLDLLTHQADLIISKSINKKELVDLDLAIAPDENINLGLKVALKLAISKINVKEIKIDCFVSVVFAVYNEHNRMLTSDEHENGEGFLHRKLEQLGWLFDDNPHIEWEMIVVDDGCPNRSGELAKRILGDSNPEASVVFLNDGIEEKHKAISSLTSTNSSRKGGSVIYGMALASEEKKKGKHVVVFTDADLSTHLGQTGLLLDPILNKKKKVAIASRREINSVVIKKGLRNTRGKMFIYLWKRLLPQLNYIIDTQCGFKAFDADLISEIVYDMEEMKFAFDIELLLKTELLYPKRIAKTAIAWIDSDAESTTGGSTYLDMLHSIAAFYRKYLSSTAEADTWAGFIEQLDQEKWDHILDNMPFEIEEAEPSNLGEKLVDVSRLHGLLI